MKITEKWTINAIGEYNFLLRLAENFVYDSLKNVSTSLAISSINKCYSRYDRQA